ncbi:MAG TPA: ABC transporter substrate-binding protein [Chloroflexota bacterium]
MRFKPLIIRTLSLMFLLTMACSPAAVPGSEGAPGGTTDGSTSTQPSRTLAIATRAEPNTLAGKSGVAGGVMLTTTKRLFNANLVIFDQKGIAQPYLAAELPKLNTASWQVNPDSTMVTTYKLKPNLVWQDGQPLTANDFAFGYRVYLTPNLGAATAPPTPSIQEVVALTH